MEASGIEAADTDGARVERALVIGEALVDIVHKGGDVTEHPGGSPANVAVALSRLGRPATLLTQYADDRLGALLEAHLKGEGVEVVREEPPSGRTSSADAHLGAGGAATYDFDLEWSIRPWKPARQPHLVHTGSLGAVLSPGSTSVLLLIDQLRAGATVTYDLNIRPEAMGPLDGVRTAAFAVVGRSDVVKASDEDLAHLFPELDTADAAKLLLEHGPTAVVVTRGAQGATVATAEGTVDVAAPQVDVVDTIGAGDSFCAALLDGLWELGLLGGGARESLRGLDGDGWRRVLEHATAAAAVTVTRPGADPPRRHELP